MLKFSEIKIGDRFTHVPGSRVYQKVGVRHGVDISEGPDTKGAYFQDYWNLDDTVALANDVPPVSNDVPTKRDN